MTKSASTNARVMPMRGFTLIELMIVVAIVGILATIAFPSYQSYVRKGNRGAAQAFMMDVAARQGQYLIDNRAYAASLAELSITPPARVATSYTVTTTSPGTNPPSFAVTAVPQGDQVSETCGTLTLGSDGSKTASGSGSCW